MTENNNLSKNLNDGKFSDRVLSKKIYTKGSEKIIDFLLGLIAPLILFALVRMIPNEYGMIFFIFYIFSFFYFYKTRKFVFCGLIGNAVILSISAVLNFRVG